MAKLRNILMLSHGLGSYYRARGYAEQLVDRGYQVDVVTISERNRLHPFLEFNKGVRIIHSPDLLWGRLRTGWDAWDCVWRTLRLSGKRVDLIKCYDSRPVSVIPAFALKRLMKVPVVMNWGDWWGRGGTTMERSEGFSHQLDRIFSPIETFFEESFHRHADGVIVMSEALRKRAIALGVPESKIRIIVHGADTERVRPRDRTVARAALGLSQDTLLCGYLGAIFPRDAELLIQAHRRLLAEVPTAKTVLIGHTKYRIAEGAATNLIRTGQLSYEGVLQWIAACDLMLLPLCDSIANRGRWPSKVVDYMAAGRPVVATNVGDVARLIGEGGAGLLTAANPESLAQGILRLYADPHRSEMGLRGREIACKRLLWTVQTDYLQEFLEQVYEEARRSSRQHEYA
jgi:glycosyltransferase involved in cell wall biosynthesis